MNSFPETTGSRESDTDASPMKIFHALMKHKVQEILLISSPYDAFIMEQDGRLAGRIIHEYRGLNLSRPPRLTWVSTAGEALALLEKKWVDLVITMPRVDDMHPFELGGLIRSRFPRLPSFLLAHTTSPQLHAFSPTASSPFDQLFVWEGNTDLLLALVKQVEDRLNVAADTRRAQVPVIILVEDSPLYLSRLVPMLYREIVLQTRRVIEDAPNEEHRILRMRARPKLLTAGTYEEAQVLYREYRDFVCSVISDARFPKNGRLDPAAGVSLLRMVRADRPELPLLQLSADAQNRRAADAVSAVFLNKDDPLLGEGLRSFLQEHLGFGDFVFRYPSGKEFARVPTLQALSEILHRIPDAVLCYHAARNQFSAWLMARAEIELAAQLRPLKVSDFSDPEEIRRHLTHCIDARRKARQRGEVLDFSPDAFAPDAPFTKIGNGSLGGKARGLVFFSSLLEREQKGFEEYENVQIGIPSALVITTEGFDLFMAQSGLDRVDFQAPGDAAIRRAFFHAPFPPDLHRDLSVFVAKMRSPLAVRSSSLLEDSQAQPFAGVYDTILLPNHHASGAKRLSDLVAAIKQVYASIFLSSARTFARNTLRHTGEDKMAVLIQPLAGTRRENLFYPAVSGVAHSHNFYPLSYMKPEDGVACIAVGFGKTVMDGLGGLRFCPKYPELLPGFSSVTDILDAAQQRFYALDMSDADPPDASPDTGPLVAAAIEQAQHHFPVRYLCDTYLPEENRLRASAGSGGHPVVTFSNILKHKSPPLGAILSRLLEIGRKGMGGGVELEFSLDAPDAREGGKWQLSVLQIRPMAGVHPYPQTAISEKERERAVCFSEQALGNGWFEGIQDVLYVKPDEFAPARNVDLAAAVAMLNHRIRKAGGRYLLVGPGRWGSADRWLGIPVRWKDISEVGVVVETASEQMAAAPSQGTHFFHNITSRGIGYITIRNGGRDFLDRRWLETLQVVYDTPLAAHLRAPAPLTIKIDGKTARAVILA